MSSTAPPETAPSAPEGPRRAPGERRGRRVAQIVFFSVLVWIIVSGAAQILGEGLFARRVPRDAATCRAELASLRARLTEAVLAHDAEKGELAAVVSFRNALGGEAGRAWDVRVTELIDGCPANEAAAAYALARLRAGNEAMIRIDAQQMAPARNALRGALAPAGNPVSP